MMAHVDIAAAEDEMEPLAAVKPAGQKWIQKKKEAVVSTGGTSKIDKWGWDKTVQITLCRGHMKFGASAYN